MTPPSYKISQCLITAEQEAIGSKDGFHFMQIVAAAYANGGITNFGSVREDNNQLVSKDTEKAIHWYNLLANLDKVPEEQKVAFREKITELEVMLDSDDDEPTLWI